MFTGIITDIGTIISLEKNGDLRASIKTGYDTSGIAIGASISCSGACMTVVKKNSDSFVVDISAESVACTNIGEWKVGSRINLERAMCVGDELGGHIVSGHVDGLAILEDIKPFEGSHILTFRAPENLAMFIAEKGSVTLDGISLTVNQVKAAEFKVNIIPHTFENTTFRDLSVESKVNLEIDTLARYVARIMEFKTK